MVNSAHSPRRVLVVLAAHGEAENAGLRENYAVGWQTLEHASHVITLPAPLRTVICAAGALRKWLSGKAGSRHNEVTRAQAGALEQALAGDQATRYQVVAAFSAKEPGVATVLAGETADEVLICSMIPTDSRLSCGLFCRAAAAQPAGKASRPLARLWDDPDLIAVHQAHITDWLANNEEAAQSGARPHESSALIITLHGTLLADKHGKAPDFHTGNREKTRYGEALQVAFTALAGRPWQRVEIAYLNHAVGGHWSQPTLEDCLARLSDEGVTRVYAYPAEHLVDSVETARLADIMAGSTLKQTFCLPCLNTSPLLIDFLAGRVRAAVRQDGSKVNGQACDHCPLVTQA